MIAALLAVVAFGIAIAGARRRWIVVTVVGSSMAPTLRDGQRLLARRFGRGTVVRGDVIVFRIADPDDELGIRIKRVTAVWPSGLIAVAGDNPQSQGSRELGLIEMRDVIATAPV